MLVVSASFCRRLDCGASGFPNCLVIPASTSWAAPGVAADSDASDAYITASLSSDTMSPGVVDEYNQAISTWPWMSSEPLRYAYAPASFTTLPWMPAPMPAVTPTIADGATVSD